MAKFNTKYFENPQNFENALLDNMSDDGTVFYNSGKNSKLMKEHDIDELNKSIDKLITENNAKFKITPKSE